MPIQIPRGAVLIVLAACCGAVAADPITAAPATATSVATDPITQRVNEITDKVAVGRKLVQENCVSCHQDEVYTRPDHFVTSMDGLRAQIGRCEQSLGLKWFEDDIDNVARYLNEGFYKFP